LKSSSFFLILAIVLGVSGFGILANDIAVTPQEYGTRDSITEFDTFSCECRNPTPGPGDPLFGMEFCDFDPGSPGYIGTIADMTCNTETLAAANAALMQSREPSTSGSGSRGISGNFYSNYGSALTENYWDGEGCDVEFWKANQFSINDYTWPVGYDPQSLYDEVFLWDIAISRIIVTAHEEISEDPTLEFNFRGRVDSDEASVGTATFARESTTQESETTETNEESERTTTVVGEFTLALDGSSDPSGESIEEINRENNPTLTQIISLPNIQSDPDTSYGSINVGGINELARQSVAAMLNAAHPTIYYRYSVDEVIRITQTSIMTGQYYFGIDEFSYYNSLHESSVCPLT